MDEAHKIDLQTRLSFHERTIDELNQMVYQQDQRIIKLEQNLHKLQEKFNALIESFTVSDFGHNEKPPALLI